MHKKSWIKGKRIHVDELKNLEKEILVFIKNFCDSNEIIYFLSGGTLLGALRHQGFIPWDDDIDIMLPRPDYEKFIKMFPRHPYLKLCVNSNHPNYPFAFATVNDTRTVKVEDKLRSEVSECLSVNVDVFPIDGLPDSVEDSIEFFKKIKMCQNMQECATKKFGKGPSLHATILKNAGILVYRILEKFGLSSISDKVQKFASTAMLYPYEKSKYVGVTAISHYGIKERNVKDDYFPVRKVIFEGEEFNCPNNYDVYLSQLYGDYMTIPPIEMQQTHHTSNCFWR